MHDINELELCIELIQSAVTPEEAFKYFCAVLSQSGYDRITYSLVTDHPSLGLPKQHGLATSYPQDWMRFYEEHHYMALDPVVRQVLSGPGPFFWCDLLNDPKLPKAAREMMQQAADAGLNSGIGISLPGEAGEVAGVGLARTDPYQDRKDYDFLAKAYLLSTVFHVCYRDMIQNGAHSLPALTERERDVLYWAAEGKTDQEIALILGITFHTIRFHWRQIFNKLDVHGRSFAIAKSIRFGLVLPEIVRTPRIEKYSPG
ncbi:helix-turn-helix transcriptional regulator [Marinobacterium sp. YM272]|uniref:helix-turn-helix transcriptional regulator n=1 Tax=Marinobacterium sp. YM272 TaxID=3421654 RepID=UPI003D7F787F